MTLIHPPADVRIDAERVFLREFLPSDFEAAHEYGADPRVGEHLGPPNTPETTRAFLERCGERRARTPRTELELALCERSSGELMGGCGLEHLDAGDCSAMLGYAMNPRYWGQGYMTDGLRALLTYGFRELALHRVWAMCAVANTRSIAILERLRFRREGTLVDHQLLHGRWSSSHLYAMLAQDFDRSETDQR